MTDTNPLVEFFDAEGHHEIDKWLHYFDIYHRHFERFRGRKPVVVEFGIFHGGSLQMWKDYFGPGAELHGIDINPVCKGLAEPGVTIHIGDQEDRDFLRGLADTIGHIDIVIEDGGHEFGQQIATFEEIYPRMSPDGVFLIEDLHTSYWPNYGGGVGTPGTFIEYAKGLVDQLNAWHWDESGFEPDAFPRTTSSMHLYPSVAVFERAVVTPPSTRKSGTPFLREEDLVAEQQPKPVAASAPPPSLARRAARKARRLLS